MQHPFSVLGPEYERLMAAMTYTRSTEIDARAAQLIKLKDNYTAVSLKTGVPVVWLMAINERESGSKFSTYFGNGQSLKRKTTLVPAGHGPFDSWYSGCCDALAFERLVGLPVWTWTFALYRGEAWNGFGPRDRGYETGYLWGGTNIYTGGKYIRDGVWSATAKDAQLGIVPLMRALVALDPSLDLPGWPAAGESPDIVAPAPAGVDGGPHGTAWLQASLNVLLKDAITPLVVDGSYGRRTAAAVRIFQQAHGLETDGLSDPLTIAAVLRALNPPAPVVPAAPMAAKACMMALAPAAIPAPVDVSKTAADLCRGIYAYAGDAPVVWDHIVTDADDLYAAVKRVGDTDYVIFRGSVTSSDWVHNVEAWSTVVPQLGPVHYGFNLGIAAAWEKIAALIGPKFVIAGHSRGAGQAKICTGYAVRGNRAPLALVTFGAPRAGYQQFADYIKSVPMSSYRNIDGSDTDPVTLVPFDIPNIEPFVDECLFTDITVKPETNDPWPGAFALHHMQYYSEYFGRS